LNFLGNKFYQIKEYEKADIEYQKALLQFEYTFADTDEEQKRVDKLTEQCNTNMALVKFNLKKYKECIHHCSMVP
jgi:CHASE3 domain sensor protein